jgi:diadenosine tetraphosphate (Ap4A) HIT family hydrolase
MNCLTCEANAGRIRPAGGVILATDFWQAEHGIDRLVRGYVVLKTRRHIHETADLAPDEATSLGPTLQMLLRSMRTALAPERVYVCSFAETVHHLHFHLIPRYADMPALGPSLMADLFAGRWGCTEAEAGAASDGIRAALAR